jgi:hypothetical protein
MREDLVTPATGRLLERAGLRWEPEPGDWCAGLGDESAGETRAGLWLVVAVDPGVALGVMDAAGRWPMARVPLRACVWLPSVGKLKRWLRARGYRVATGEVEGVALGVGPRHVCRVVRPGVAGAPVETDGPTEAEAAAAAVVRVLADEAPAGEAGGWAAAPGTGARPTP